MILKQETLIILSNVYVRIPKGLRVNATVLLGGKNSPLVLHQCNFILYKWKWTRMELIATLVLLPTI